jgi:hypothetical protein
MIQMYVVFVPLTLSLRGRSNKKHWLSVGGVEGSHG